MERVELSETENEARDYLCLALDMDDEDQIIKCVDELSDLIGYFKLNFAYHRFGPQIVEKLLDRGVKVFLDLKIHDIPNTVSGYAENIVQLGVHIVTVHTGGGTEMMKEMVNAVKRKASDLNIDPPKILGVTLLTSIDERTMNGDMNIQSSINEEVIRRATMASDSGLDGIVCSAVELPLIKSKLPKNFFYLTPGVRSKGVISHDHKRVSTPTHAIRSGASLLVVGREILDAENRREAAMRIVREVSLGRE